MRKKLVKPPKGFLLKIQILPEKAVENLVFRYYILFPPKINVLMNIKMGGEIRTRIY